MFIKVNLKYMIAHEVFANQKGKTVKISFLLMLANPSPVKQSILSAILGMMGLYL